MPSSVLIDTDPGMITAVAALTGRRLPSSTRGHHDLSREHHSSRATRNAREIARRLGMYAPFIRIAAPLRRAAHPARVSRHEGLGHCVPDQAARQESDLDHAAQPSPSGGCQSSSMLICLGH